MKARRDPIVAETKKSGKQKSETRKSETRKPETQKPVPGQCIIFKRADGLYDVEKIDEAGERATVRAGLKQIEDAYHVARNSLSAGRVLYADHSAPDVFEKYTFLKEPTRTR
jgi:hypothetical protein